MVAIDARKSITRALELARQGINVYVASSVPAAGAPKQPQ